MITEKNIDNLYRITSNLSFRDYKNSLESYRQHHKRIKWGDFSYSLSGETLEARDYYGMACNHDVTREQEEAIKAYLLKIRYSQPELMEGTNPNYEQWKRVKTA